MINIFISTLIFFLLFKARSFAKKNGRAHARWISAVILADLIFVAYLSFGHQVFKDFSSKMNWLLLIHILLSLSCVIIYLFSFYVGLKLVRGDKSYLNKMRLIDKWIIPLRGLVTITIIFVKLYAAKSV